VFSLEPNPATAYFLDLPQPRHAPEGSNFSLAVAGKSHWTATLTNFRIDLRFVGQITSRRDFLSSPGRKNILVYEKQKL
jgi:hypothetical protein